MRPELIFQKKIPERKYFSPQSFLIYDKKLWGKSAALNRFIRGFQYRYAVEAGETLKSLEYFPAHVKRMLQELPFLERVQPRFIASVSHSKKTGTRQRTKQAPNSILVLGGGSVGDFAAFFASIYKRGVRLEMLPSTWLSAIDSAHGGKSALNVGDKKNVLGTFYPAEKIYLVEDLLGLQGKQLLQDAVGEAVKISLLNRKLYHKASRLRGPSDLWRLLPDLIDAKYSIVESDLWDLSGRRAVLNLGHSLGHVLETQCHLSHGRAVFWGTLFAVEWSRHRGFLTQKQFDEILNHFVDPWAEMIGEQPRLKSEASALRVLSADKKASSSQMLQFVFLKGPAKPYLVRVKFEEILQEAKRQGFLRG